MKNVLIGFAVAVVLAAAAHAAEPTGQEIIAAVDAGRNPGQAFRVVDNLTEYVGGQPHNSMQIVVFAVQNKTTRQFNNLVRYVLPSRDAGKMVLMNGSNMWFYDPSSKASVRISPQQRLLGQASNGDVATVNLAKDYAAKNPDMPVKFVLDWQKRHLNPTWRVYWGESVTTSSFGVYVDGTYDKYVAMAH